MPQYPNRASNRSSDWVSFARRLRFFNGTGARLRHFLILCRTLRAEHIDGTHDLVALFEKGVLSKKREVLGVAGVRSRHTRSVQPWRVVIPFSSYLSSLIRRWCRSNNFICPILPSHASSGRRSAAANSALSNRCDDYAKRDRRYGGISNSIWGIHRMRKRGEHPIFDVILTA